MSSDDVLDVLGSVGCMAPESIAEALAEREGYDTRTAKLAVMEAISDDVLEEHPTFSGHYRKA